MDPVHLHHVFDYTDRDRAFWDEHLEHWVPRRIIDAHYHIANPDLRISEPNKGGTPDFWVSEVSRPIRAEDAERCLSITYPGREVRCLAVGPPSLDYDIPAINDYLADECTRRGWYATAILRADWDADEVDAQLSKPGILGLKPYYSLIPSADRRRESIMEADILDFLTPQALEAANARRAWITLHVPKADRLPHPSNIAQIKQIRREYPDVKLVIAHLGRCYCEPYAVEGLPQLADDEGIYFDICAVLNPAVLRLGMELFGPGRLIYGTDNPIFYMRGRRQWEGRRYINRTDYPFHFNTEREAPEIEAGYTLYMYEALYALKQVCEELDVPREDVERIFRVNAEELLADACGGPATAGDDAPA